MILDRYGNPINQPKKIMLPIGRANPEDMRSKSRTKSGKPRIRVVPGMKLRDFVRGDTAYTPIEQNLHDDTLFRLRKYESQTATLIPKDKR